MKNIVSPEFSKTKILCTLGPATCKAERIKELIYAGMDGVRLNFSHGDYNFYKNLFKQIDSACRKTKSSLSILIDLQGPKIRIGELVQPEIKINSGDKIEITIDKVIGTNKIISTSYKALVKDAKISERILIDDGIIKLKILKKKTKSLVCLIEEGGILKPRKGMNLPEMTLSTPSVTKKDLSDLKFALQFRVDYIALSFVRSANDIIKLRRWLSRNGYNVPIIAKIEKKEAVDNIDSILNEADGLMVARGDLGVELPTEEVPNIQKSIIKKCNSIGKLVITATQMLESMIHNPIPTRAEASDVANAVLDGTEAVMLSGETSVGKYPLKTVQIMNKIILNAEHYLTPKSDDFYAKLYNVEENLFDSVGKAISLISKQINAAAIVIFTFQGRTATNVAKYRPNAKIIAVSNSFQTMNRLSLRWGITSIFSNEINKEHISIDKTKKILLSSGKIKKGDVVIFAAGAPYSEHSQANWIRFEIV